MADKKVEKADAPEVEMTEAGSHVATARGYAKGQMIEEGMAVPAGVPVGSWMAAAPKSEAKAKGEAKAEETPAE